MKLFFYLAAAACVIASAAPARADSVRSREAMVEGLFLEGQYQKVIDISDRLIDGRAASKDEMLYLAGLSAIKLGKYSDARSSFQEIMTECPGAPRSFDAYVGLGDTYLLEGNAAAAIPVYENALKAFPGHRNTAVIYYRLSDAYSRAGDADKGRYYFDSAKMVAPLAFEARNAPVPRQAGPRAASASQAVPASSAASGEGARVSIQVASFKNRDNANRFVDRLTTEGFDCYAETASTGSGTVYRVKVGRFASMAGARDTIKRLRSRGYAIKVCTGEICE